MVNPFLHNSEIIGRRMLVHLLSSVDLVDILFYTQMLDSLDVALQKQDLSINAENPSTQACATKQSSRMSSVFCD